MKEIGKLCVQGIMEHLRSKNRAFFGPLEGKYPGAFCRLAMRDRSYFVMYIVEEDLERVFVDVFPQCICERPYRQMMNAYVNNKTSGYKSGRVDVDDENGEVRIRTETSIVDHAVTAGDIDDMEKLAIHVSDCLERRLDKIAHGVFFNDDDPEVMSEAERRHLRRQDDDDDDDDDDVDDESFSDLLKHFAAMRGGAPSGEENDGDGDGDSDGETPLVEGSVEGDETAEEQFDVVLMSYTGSKISTMRVVSELTGVNATDARTLTAEMPSVIMSGVSRAIADHAVAKLEEVGAKAEVH